MFRRKYIDTSHEEKIKASCYTERKELLSMKYDESGIKYSFDGKRLLRCKGNVSNSYVIPEGVEVICDKAFMNVTNVESVKLPETVKYIGEHAFSGCNALEFIKVPIGSKDLMTALLPEYNELILEEVQTENICIERINDFPDPINREIDEYDYPIEKYQFEIISDITSQQTGLTISNFEVNVVGDYQVELHFDVEGKINENFYCPLLSMMKTTKSEKPILFVISTIKKKDIRDIFQNTLSKRFI